jgi:hypothetical protein
MFFPLDRAPDTRQRQPPQPMARKPCTWNRINTSCTTIVVVLVRSPKTTVCVSIDRYVASSATNRRRVDAIRPHFEGFRSADPGEERRTRVDIISVPFRKLVCCCPYTNRGYETRYSNSEWVWRGSSFFSYRVRYYYCYRVRREVTAVSMARAWGGNRVNRSTGSGGRLVPRTGEPRAVVHAGNEIVVSERTV